MRQYTIRRLISLLPVILGLSLITYGLMDMVPRDPAEVLASYGKDVEPTPEEIEEVRRELGLDRCFHPWIVFRCTADDHLRAVDECHQHAYCCFHVFYFDGCHQRRSGSGYVHHRRSFRHD